MYLVPALVCSNIIFIIFSFYFYFNRKVVVEKKTVTEIDPMLESQLAGYEHTLRSIAYSAKTIKEARQLADDVIGDGK
jgi:hypothetical protein